MLPSRSTALQSPPILLLSIVSACRLAWRLSSILLLPIDTRITLLILYLYPFLNAIALLFLNDFCRYVYNTRPHLYSCNFLHHYLQKPSGPINHDLFCSSIKPISFLTLALVKIRCQHKSPNFRVWRIHALKFLQTLNLFLLTNPNCSKGWYFNLLSIALFIVGILLQVSWR